MTLLNVHTQDCTVRDTGGVDWFKIEGSALSITSQRTMTDSKGRIIAGYRKKLLSLYATAYITTELSGQILPDILGTKNINYFYTSLIKNNETHRLLFVWPALPLLHCCLSGQTLVYATIKKQSLLQLESSANIFIHDVSRFYLYDLSRQNKMKYDKIMVFSHH